LGAFCYPRGMSDLLIAALVVGILVFFRLASVMIARQGGGPTDDAAAARRKLLYLGIVFVVAISFPVLIYDHYKFARWLFGG